MKVSELIELGFVKYFVPAEESGHNPFFFLMKGNPDKLELISNSVLMSKDHNDGIHIKEYVGAQVEVEIFTYDDYVDDNFIRTISKVI
jgi:hypothetical protein